MNDASASQQIDAIVRKTTGWRGEREDTTYVGFGTVRPRVQIPGPRPASEFTPSRPRGATIDAMSSNRLRILLVDDHEVVRDGVKSLINANDDMSVVAEAGTVAEAVAQAERTRPDVVVMDVRLAHSSGIEATREIRAKLEKDRLARIAAKSWATSTC